MTASYPLMQTRQVRALVAPTRQEIIDALGVLGTASVAELAALLGRAPDSLYHHLRVLQGVELVHRDERERDGGGREAVYSLPQSLMSIAYDLADEEFTRALNGVVRAMLRIASRDFEAATRSGLATVDGPHRNLRSSRVKRPLDREQVRRINEHFERIVEIMAAPPRDPAGATLHAITFLMSPMAPNRRAPQVRATRPRKRSG